MNLDTALQEVRSIFDNDDRPDDAGYVSVEVAARQFVAGLDQQAFWKVFQQASTDPIIKAEAGTVTVTSSMLVDVPACTLKLMLAQLLRCDAKLCQLEEERHQEARDLNMTPRLITGPDGRSKIVYQPRKIVKPVDDTSYWGQQRARQAQFASR